MSKQKSSQVVLGTQGADLQLSIFGIIWSAITANLIVSFVMIVLAGAFFYWKDNPNDQTFLLLEIGFAIFAIVMIFVIKYTYLDEKENRQQIIRTQILTELQKEKMVKTYYQLEWIKTQFSILNNIHQNVIDTTSDILEGSKSPVLKAQGKSLRRITKKIYDNLDDIQLDFDMFKSKWFGESKMPLVPQLDAETIKLTKILEKAIEKEA